jgi:hypothetical protein
VCRCSCVRAGGQVGDQGVLRVLSTASDAANPTSQADSGLLLVSGVRKAAGGRLWVHAAELQSGSIAVGQTVRAVWRAVVCLGLWTQP